MNVAAKQDLALSVKAVLARFNGHRHDAMRYCLKMSQYPHLAEEYKFIGARIAEIASNERCERAKAAIAGRA